MGEQRTRPTVKEIKEAYDHLFNSSITLLKIKDAALGGRLFSDTDNEALGVAGRSLAWKLFLIPPEPLQPTVDWIPTPPLKALQYSRQEYKDLLLEKMRAPDGSYEDGLYVPGTSRSPPRRELASTNWDRNNPLSLHDENPWTDWFASMDLRKTILQDVERTFPDIGYFRDNEVQAQLTNILFVYSATHPDIGYRQGMHELLAPLYYVVDYDSVPDDSSQTSDSNFREMCARCWVAADAWALFSAVMNSTSRWYEWREGKEHKLQTALASHVQLNVPSADATMKPYVAPIIESCDTLQNSLLKRVDPELWRRLQSAGIEPQIYGIRWLRLLFTREFPMHDAMILWDGLFACDPSFDLAQWICVAMLVRIRNQLIPADYSTQLTYLLRYPSPPQDGALPTLHPSALLIRQALTLQMSPTPTTGVSIISENSNLLNIPMDVPEPPEPPRRRRPGDRTQSSSISEAAIYGRSSGEASGSRAHTRQGSTPMGLPEMIARGLLERGESLGINKTVMNAVTELKRNLPDLSASLARLPGTPNTSYAAYPLIDERPPSERPPWEPRTRFEMERDVSETRGLQRRLGDSLSWIVDTLLLDGGGVKDEEQAKVLQNRKREALESLAYVRDIMKGTVNPSEIEGDRLISEEEAMKRRVKTQQEKEASDKASSTATLPQISTKDRLAIIPTPPQPAAAAVPSAGWRSTTDYFAPSPSLPGRPPSTKLPSSSLRQVTPPSTFFTPSVLTPNSQSTPMAPWVHTRSSFASSESPLATLPRLPPKSSMTLHPSHGSSRLPSPFPPPAYPPAQSPPETNVSRDQPPRRNVPYDPLGAIS